MWIVEMESRGGDGGGGPGDDGGGCDGPFNTGGLLAKRSTARRLAQSVPLQDRFAFPGHGQRRLFRIFLLIF